MHSTRITGMCVPLFLLRFLFNCTTLGILAVVGAMVLDCLCLGIIEPSPPAFCMCPTPHALFQRNPSPRHQPPYPYINISIRSAMVCVISHANFQYIDNIWTSAPLCKLKYFLICSASCSTHKKYSEKLICIHL